MEAVEDAIVEPIEAVLDKVGAMTGELAPLKRAAIGAGIGYAIAYGLKPGVAFDKDGEIPFALTASQSDLDANRVTYVPAWMIVVVPAVVLSVFI